MHDNCEVQVVARLPQKLKSMFIEFFSAGPFGATPFENISKKLDLRL